MNHEIKFKECFECAPKPGSPYLCAQCLWVRENWPPQPEKETCSYGAVNCKCDENHTPKAEEWKEEFFQGFAERFKPHQENLYEDIKSFIRSAISAAVEKERGKVENDVERIKLAWVYECEEAERERILELTKGMEKTDEKQMRTEEEYQGLKLLEFSEVKIERIMNEQRRGYNRALRDVRKILTQ